MIKKSKALVLSTVLLGGIVASTLTGCGEETEEVEKKYSIVTECDNTKGSIKIEEGKATGKVGGDVGFTVSAKDGFKIKTIKINGQTVDNDKTSFKPKEGENKIEVTFEAKTPTPVVTKKGTVTIATVTGGTVTSDKKEGKVGDTVTLTVTPDGTHEIKEVKANNTALTANDAGKYTFTLVEGVNNVTVTFKDKTPESGGETETKTGTVVIGTVTGGTVEADKESGNVGEVVTLTVTADPNYTIGEVKANNTALTANDEGKYTFELVEGNNQVTATFTKNTPTVQTGNVVITQATGGTISANPTTGNVDDEITLTVTADPNYTIGEVKANNTVLTATTPGTYKFKLVEGDNPVTATFNKNEDQGGDTDPVAKRILYVETPEWFNESEASLYVKAWKGDTPLFEDNTNGLKATYTTKYDEVNLLKYWSFELPEGTTKLLLLRCNPAGDKYWNQQTETFEVSAIGKDNNLVKIDGTKAPSDTAQPATKATVTYGTFDPQADIPGYPALGKYTINARFTRTWLTELKANNKNKLNYFTYNVTQDPTSAWPGNDSTITGDSFTFDIYAKANTKFKFNITNEAGKVTRESKEIDLKYADLAKETPINVFVDKDNNVTLDKAEDKRTLYVAWNETVGIDKESANIYLYKDNAGEEFNNGTPENQTDNKNGWPGVPMTKHADSVKGNVWTSGEIDVRDYTHVIFSSGTTQTVGIPLTEWSEEKPVFKIDKGEEIKRNGTWSTLDTFAQKYGTIAKTTTVENGTITVLNHKEKFKEDEEVILEVAPKEGYHTVEVKNNGTPCTKIAENKYKTQIQADTNTLTATISENTPEQVVDNHNVYYRPAKHVIDKLNENTKDYKLYAYAFGGETGKETTNATWPGEPMEKVGDDYKIVLDKNTLTKIKFVVVNTAKENQVELEEPAGGSGHYITIDWTKASETKDLIYVDGAWQTYPYTAPVTDTYHITVNLNNGWKTEATKGDSNRFYYYIFNSNNPEEPKYPGHEVNLKGNTSNTVEFDVKPGENTGICFYTTYIGDKGLTEYLNSGNVYLPYDIAEGKKAYTINLEFNNQNNDDSTDDIIGAYFTESNAETQKFFIDVPAWWSDNNTFGCYVDAFDKYGNKISEESQFVSLEQAKSGFTLSNNVKFIKLIRSKPSGDNTYGGAKSVTISMDSARSTGRNTIKIGNDAVWTSNNDLVKIDLVKPAQ